jgi:peptide deformylase
VPGAVCHRGTVPPPANAEVRGSPDILHAMTAPYEIRLIGDPVLRQRASEITDVNGALVRLAEDMLDTMYEAPGLGLAGPQVGVQKRIFVYDVGEGPQVVINPEVRESRGEWAYEEGCLSIPDLTFELVRPKEVHLVGYDLDGNELSIEADEILARCFQHELDHLDGVLYLERLEEDDRKAAMKVIRERRLTAADLQDAEVAAPARPSGGFSLR